MKKKKMSHEEMLKHRREKHKKTPQIRMYSGATNINSFEWVNTSNWQRLEVSQIEFDTEINGVTD